MRDEKMLEDMNERMLRQIASDWVKNEGRVTSAAFRPFKKDEGWLSVSRESMVTANLVISPLA